VTLPACRKKEVAMEVVAEPEVSDAHARVTEFEGDWIFVGQAHPWRQGDQHGYAGFAQIRGTEVRFHFVRSPNSSPETVGGLWPIPEEDRSGVSADYVGKLVDAKGEGMPGTKRGMAPTWKISYPTSALDPASQTVNAKDFTRVEVGSEDLRSSVSGFLSMRRRDRVEVRLVQALTRPDGSRYSVEAPINGVHRLQTEEH
jgi:hypothetical protein